MPDYSCHEWYPNTGTQRELVVEAGLYGEILWLFDPAINQLILQNNSQTTPFTVCYSGYASTLTVNSDFANGPPGEVALIEPGKIGWFSDNKCEYDQRFTPSLLNTYVSAHRVLITPGQTYPSLYYYDFSFKIESVGDTEETAVMIVGDNITQGLKDGA